jgi:hypothetical protein
MKAILLGALIATVPLAANATIITYTCSHVAIGNETACGDYNTWLAAAGGAGNLDTEEFTATPLSVATVVGTTSSGTVSAGKWSDTLIFPHYVDFAYTGGTTSAVGGYFDLSPNSYGTGLLISLFLAPSKPSDTPTQVGVLNDFGSPQFDYGFFGVISDTPIYAIRLGTQEPGLPGVVGTQEAYTLDNLAFASGPIPEPMASVPEPGTDSLLVLGLLGTSLARRRFRTRQPSKLLTSRRGVTALTGSRLLPGHRNAVVA